MKEKLKFKLDSIPARFGGGFSKPDISAPSGMRRLAPPPTPYLARTVENVIISKPAQEVPAARSPARHAADILPNHYEIAAKMKFASGPGPTGSRRRLPFINQTGVIAFKQTLGICLRRHEVLIAKFRVVQVNDALCDLLRSSRLATPLGTLNQYSAFCIQRITQNTIKNSIFVVFHAHIISNLQSVRQSRCGSWRIFVVMFGVILLW
jgi:hypothetical protein